MGESGISIYTRQVAECVGGEKLLCGTGSLAPFSVTSGWDGEGGRLKGEGMYV